jgi:hypothetical protein
VREGAAHACHCAYGVGAWPQVRDASQELQRVTLLQGKGTDTASATGLARSCQHLPVVSVRLPLGRVELAEPEGSALPWSVIG